MKLLVESILALIGAGLVLGILVSVLLVVCRCAGDKRD
jgi:hypothetical protein